MYVVDLFKRLFHKNNIMVLVYLILNVFVSAFLIGMLEDMFSPQIENFSSYLIQGLIAYAISLVVALSPIGEMIMRFQTDCREIEDSEQLNYIQPIFEDVYRQAREKDATIPENVRLYMNDEEEANAFATGRKTICVTKGLLNMPEDYIRAALSHEFGHLAHKDTDLVMLVSVGNLVISAVTLILRFIIAFIQFIFAIAGCFMGGKDGLLTQATSAIGKWMFTVVIAGFTKIWTKIGVLLVMKSSRENEYSADQFAFELGYGDALCNLLENVDSVEVRGLFASLTSAHPPKEQRIQRLHELKYCVNEI